MKTRWFIPCLLLLAYACNTGSISAEKDYYKWINDGDHRLFAVKTINGVNLVVKYLPPEYLAYKEYRGGGVAREKLDSLIAQYNHNRTFLLTLSLEDQNNSLPNGDIMYSNIISPEEYDNRLLELSFNIKQYIKLETESNSYVPVLHTFENTYGLSPNRGIYLVFAPGGKEQEDLLTSKELEFVFEDQLFMTGISCFVFKKNDLDNIPHINFWEK